MFSIAKTGNVPVGGSEMGYVTFGRGGKNLVLIPGLGESLRSVEGSAAALAVLYRRYTERYTVYVFGRVARMAEGYSIEDMAAAQAEALRRLGIKKAFVMGVSQGGMIAQHLAADEPGLIEKLVLVVTTARADDALRRVAERWIEMAKSGDYKGIIIDTTEKSYSEKALKKYRPLYPVFSRIGKPKEFGRFIAEAGACMRHDASGKLGGIRCPTLIVGGDSDRIVGGHASEELAGQIPGSRLIVYQGLGHMAYEEAKDFDRRVLDFLGE